MPKTFQFFKRSYYKEKEEEHIKSLEQIDWIAAGPQKCEVNQAFDSFVTLC